MRQPVVFTLDGLMKYDDASWHYGGEFPEGLPDEAGATHIGMFLAWALLKGLVGDEHLELCELELEELRARKISPGSYLLKACDEKFSDLDLSEEGNAFARVYYEPDEDDAYLADYERLFPDLASLYEAPDTWDTFENVRQMLDERYASWKGAA